jgi:hypothetical protein
MFRHRVKFGCRFRVKFRAVVRVRDRMRAKPMLWLGLVIGIVFILG